MRTRFPFQYMYVLLRRLAQDIWKFRSLIDQHKVLRMGAYSRARVLRLSRRSCTSVLTSPHASDAINAWMSVAENLVYMHGLTRVTSSPSCAHITCDHDQTSRKSCGMPRRRTRRLADMLHIIHLGVSGYSGHICQRAEAQYLCQFFCTFGFVLFRDSRL